MMPATRKLIDLMRADEKPEIDAEPAVFDEEVKYDPKLLQLRLKKKYQLGMVKKMLEEGGYGELAKMTNVGKKSYEFEE